MMNGDHMQTKFRDLKIGDTFDFISGSRFDSFFDRCTKVSPRRYTWTRCYADTKRARTTLQSSVGTINVQVYHVNESA